MITVATQDSVVHERAKEEEASSACPFESGRWVRSCPICSATLTKSELSISIICECGWQWQG